MTDKNQPDNFYTKLRILTDELRKADFFNPRLLQDLAILLLLRLLSHYSGACRVVRAMKDEHIARLIVAIVDEKTTVGVPPFSERFTEALSINHGQSADNRKTISRENYLSQSKEIPIEIRLQKINRCRISFVLVDDLKRILVAKKHNNFSKENEIGHVPNDEIIKRFCSKPKKTQKLLKQLHMESILDDDPAASKPNPFD